MKKYYIEISSWNLLESFVTESISPFSFYQERDFGNNLSRYLSGEKERSYHLILSTKDLPAFVDYIKKKTITPFPWNNRFLYRYVNHPISWA